MSIQYDVAVRNAKLDAVSSAIGANPILKILGGGLPNDCASPDRGKPLAQSILPSNWMRAAIDGAKEYSGDWPELIVEMTGVAGYFRIYDSMGNCRIQGGVGTRNAEMLVSSTSFVVGQAVEVMSFMIADHNG
jgi:hypothetical protein